MYMSISRDVFRVNTPNIMKAHQIVSNRVNSMKDLRLTYEKYFCEDIIPYLEKPDEAMAMANGI